MKTNQEPATLEQNKAVYRRFLQEVFNEGRLDKLDELLSQSYVLRDAPNEATRRRSPKVPDGVPTAERKRDQVIKLIVEATSHLRRKNLR